MESELPSDQHFEDELGVKGQQKSYNPWALKCHRQCSGSTGSTCF
jgi:hypothetical protein